MSVVVHLTRREVASASDDEDANHTSTLTDGVGSFTPVIAKALLTCGRPSIEVCR
jgi:hypothetical protein